MRKSLFAALMITASLALASCGIIYKPNIQQGNVLKTENVEKLQPGMTAEQVVALLGEPSIASPFAQDRWDYAYSLQRRGGDIVHKNLTVYFQNGVLVRTEGDYQEEDTDHMQAQVEQYPMVLHDKEKEAEARRQRGG